MARKVRFALLLAGLVLFLGSSPKAKLISPQDLLNLVNQDRQAHGLPGLSDNPVLNLAALAKAQDMFEKNYFAHTSPDGVSPWHWFKAVGYNYTYAGENLAEGFTNPDDLEKSWMNSPSHRANILSPFYSEVGLAVIQHNNTSVVVQLFGTKETKVTLRQ